MKKEINLFFDNYLLPNGGVKCGKGLNTSLPGRIYVRVSSQVFHSKRELLEEKTGGTKVKLRRLSSKERLFLYHVKKLLLARVHNRSPR